MPHVVAETRPFVPQDHMEFGCRLLAAAPRVEAKTAKDRPVKTRLERKPDRAQATGADRRVETLG
jgi:hypothetical protein